MTREEIKKELAEIKAELNGQLEEQKTTKTANYEEIQERLKAAGELSELIKEDEKHGINTAPLYEMQLNDIKNIMY